MKAKKFVLIYFKTVKAKRSTQEKQSELASKQNELTLQKKKIIEAKLHVLSYTLLNTLRWLRTVSCIFQHLNFDGSVTKSLFQLTQQLWYQTDAQ